MAPKAGKSRQKVTEKPEKFDILEKTGKYRKDQKKTPTRKAGQGEGK